MNREDVRTITTKVFLNDEQARNKIAGLKKMMADVEKEMQEALDAGDVAKWREKTKELKALKKEMNLLSTTAENVAHTLENLDTAAPNEIRKTITAINRELGSGHVARGTKEWEQLEEMLGRCRRELQKIDKEANAAGNRLEGTFSTLKNAMGTFIGNIYTKAASVVANLVTEVGKLATEGIEMARAAEGIEAAFERINKPGLLDELRKATHGTVNDLELMKQAVKFKDFNLPVEQLGLYLSFAQQKAKDTGESIDYLVNSIVTGLGRQSPLILDNLGLSAKQISEEAKKSGDFFGAVAKIIEERMGEAGEYMETSMDRAAQATTELQNAQRRLGEEMLPLQEKAGSAFTKIKVWILDTATDFVIYLKKAVSESIAKFIDLYNNVTPFRAALVLIANVAKVAWSVVVNGAKMAFNAFMILNDAASMFGRVFVSIFKGDIQEIIAGVDNIKNHFGNIVDAMHKLGGDIAHALVDGYNEAAEGKMFWQPDIKKPTATSGKPTGTEEDGGGGNDDGSGKGGKVITPFERETEQLKQQNAELQNELKKMYHEKLLTEEEYHEESYQAEMAYLIKMQALEQKYGKPTTETSGKIIDLTANEVNYQEAKAKKKMNDELKALDIEYKNQQTQINKDYVSGQIRSEEAFNKQRKQAEIGYQEEKLAIIRKYGGDTTDIENQISQRQVNEMKDNKAEMLKDFEDRLQGADNDTSRFAILEQMRQADLISEEQYEERKLEITEDAEERRKEIINTYAQEIGATMATVSQLFNSLQQAELNKVRSRYDKQIEAARKAGKSTTKLEQKKEKEMAKIRKKYADSEFKMKVLSIIADTAVGIARTWANVGYPWAIPLTALLAAQGVMQLAIAKNAQEQAQEIGYYEGGYTGGRRYRKEAGVVHEGEFVANHQTVNNPNIRPFLDFIDLAQRNNTVGSLTAEDISRKLGSGGTAVVTPIVNVNNDNEELKDELVRNREVNEKLTDIIEKDGINVNFPMDSFDRAYKHFNKLNNR